MSTERKGSYKPVAQGEGGKVPQMEEEQVGLKATMGLIQGCNVIIGCIIGSGIFIAPGGVLLGRIKTIKQMISVLYKIVISCKLKPHLYCNDLWFS